MSLEPTFTDSARQLSEPHFLLRLEDKCLETLLAIKMAVDFAPKYIKTE